MSARSKPRPADDPWRYGYRFVPRKGPDGRIDEEQVPLTEDDLLHPREGDAVMNSSLHGDDCAYLKAVLRERLEGRPGAVVLFDTRIDWGVKGFLKLCPDISVFRDAGEWDRGDATFYVRKAGAVPELFIEVTSDSTRKGDFGRKRAAYYRAGVPLYVIVDRAEAKPEGETCVLGFRPAPGGYVPLPVGADGRLWLEPVGLWLGIEDDRAALYDAEGNRAPGPEEAIREAAASAARATAAEKRAASQKKRADAARKRADEEALARRQAEERIRRLEAELRRRPPRP
jgi:Uma2 family endonuclease